MKQPLEETVFYRYFIFLRFSFSLNVETVGDHNMVMVILKLLHLTVLHSPTAYHILIVSFSFYDIYVSL